MVASILLNSEQTTSIVNKLLQERLLRKSPCKTGHIVCAQHVTLQAEGGLGAAVLAGLFTLIALLL